MKFSGKAVQKFFFKPNILDDGCWICNKCKQSKLSSRGYTNLVSHVKSCYGADWQNDVLKHLENNGVKVTKRNGVCTVPGDINQRVISSFYTSTDKEKRAHQWMRWLATRNMPLSEIENEITLEFSKFQGFSIETIRKYIISTAAEAAKNISSELREAGVMTLLFDGWSCDGTSTHYVAIFAGYIEPSSGNYKEVLLAVQPSLDEQDMGADAHIALCESTLDYYKVTTDNVVCLVGDNCSTNKAISRRWNLPLIGCFNHKLNLAVQEWISKQSGLQEAIDCISTLMSKASNLKAAARLRDLTMEAHGVSLKAKRHNETRWTSVFQMCKRYLRIKQELSAIESLELYLLTPAQNRLIKSVMDDFEAFNDLTTEIQAAGMDVLYCREQFDILLLYPKYYCMEKYLSDTADIIESPNFESGILKIQQGLPLTEAEANACRKLKIKKPSTVGDDDGSEDEQEPEEEMTVIERLKANRKKRKVQVTNTLVDYMDVSKLICATSNCCERLFSEAKYIMVPHRRSISPILFESLIFLKKNLSFWNVKTVSAAIKRAENGEEELFERDDNSFYD